MLVVSACRFVIDHPPPPAWFYAHKSRRLACELVGRAIRSGESEGGGLPAADDWEGVCSVRFTRRKREREREVRVEQVLQTTAVSLFVCLR